MCDITGSIRINEDNFSCQLNEKLRFDLSAHKFQFLVCDLV